ncbi:methionyl-tRNA formyltransferase [Roseobacteraceae bacterium S113]
MTYAEKIRKEEAAIDWTRPSVEVDRHIRGLSRFPGAWTMLGEARLKVLDARVADGAGAPGSIVSIAPLVVACGTGAVEITQVQRAGKGPQEAQEFLRGNPLEVGVILGA